jgi:hypothetical protein
MSVRYDERMQMIFDMREFDPYQIELFTRLFDPEEFLKQQEESLGKIIASMPKQKSERGTSPVYKRTGEIPTPTSGTNKKKKALDS